MSKVVRSVKNVTKGYSSVQVKVRNGMSFQFALCRIVDGMWREVHECYIPYGRGGTVTNTHSFNSDKQRSMGPDRN